MLYLNFVTKVDSEWNELRWMGRCNVGQNKSAKRKVMEKKRKRPMISLLFCVRSIDPVDPCIVRQDVDSAED